MNIKTINVNIRRRNLMESTIVKYCEKRETCNDYILSDMLEDLNHYNNKVTKSIQTFASKVIERTALKKFGIKNKN
jgi:ABC-type molybdenum transport system ATPase subunit/photorepair protein PhrA